MSKTTNKTRDLFQERDHLKPFEYPECTAFVDAINHSYWLFSEWNFQEDIQLYHTNLSKYERNIVKKCLLLISQIEVSVKTFWGNIYNHFPKPEIHDVGITFADSEVRHQRAYSHLLEIMGLNDEFEKIYDIPAILDRHTYLKKYKNFATARLEENYIKALILFSLFIENVSLFSQFFIIQSFNKHRKQLKDISNAISATSKEEAIHGQFGTWLINELRIEHPEFFTDELEQMIMGYSHKAYEAEQKVIDWIFDEGDTDILKKDEINAFVQKRLNDSLESIGLKTIFEVDEECLKKTMWFDEEILSDAHVDFFHQRPTSYSKKNKAITAESLF